MREPELYIRYISAVRLNNKNEIEQMLQAGFKPDRQRLFELSQTDENVRTALFNRNIKVIIDSGDFAGHVYGSFPIYNKNATAISVTTLGFYPKSDSGLSVLVGEGVVLDEVRATKRCSKNYQRHEVSLFVTEEAWRKLALWTRERVNENQTGNARYVITRHNCVRFVHNALQEVGYSDGLIDKLDPKDISKMKYKPVIYDVNSDYLRYDKQFNPLQDLTKVLDKRAKPADSLSQRFQIKVAESERARANRNSQYNFVNGFFDRYHTEQFYQRLYKDKPLKVDDLAWLLRNGAPGMETRIHDTLLHAYVLSSDRVKQKHQYNPNRFLWVTGFQLQGCPSSLDPEIILILNSFRGKKGLTADKSIYLSPELCRSPLLNFSAKVRGANSYRQYQYISFVPTRLALPESLQFASPSEVRANGGKLMEELTEREFFKAEAVDFLIQCDRQMKRLFSKFHNPVSSTTASELRSHESVEIKEGHDKMVAMPFSECRGLLSDTPVSSLARFCDKWHSTKSWQNPLARSCAASEITRASVSKERTTWSQSALMLRSSTQAEQPSNLISFSRINRNGIIARQQSPRIDEFTEVARVAAFQASPFGTFVPMGSITAKLKTSLLSGTAGVEAGSKIRNKKK